MDAGDDDAAAGAAGTRAFDASVPALPAFSGQLCALRVGASCDGPEDCADGQRCCAQFEPIAYGYTSIECADSCDAPDQFELCHPGHTCKDPSDVCRRSVIVPHDFINVCASPATVPEQSTSVELAGEVVCASDTCVAGEEVCCLRSEFDFETMKLTALPAYCAPAGSACSCRDEPPDAGTADSDAG